MDLITLAKHQNHSAKVDHMCGDVKIKVALSGGDFTSITAAIESIKDASPKKRYDVEVYPGTYLERFVTKNYVNVIGVDRDKCIINNQGDLANYNGASAIHATTTSLIEGLTIRNTNGKYPIHSDAAVGGYRLIVRNCVLQHFGKTDDASQAGTPIGIGLYSGQHIEVYDSKLIGIATGSAGIFCHNSQSSAGNGFRSLRVENCKIQNVSYGIRLNGLSSVFDQSNDAYIIGNKIQSLLGDIFIDASTDLSWIVKAYGNAIRRVNQPSNQYIVEEPGFTRRVHNYGSNVTRGMVVVLWDSGAIKGSTSADSPLVVGVALEDIPSGSKGVIQVSGHVNAVKVNGTAAISSDGLLSTHTEYGIAKAGTTNPFAVAKGAYSTADSNGVIPAILLPRMLA